MNDAPAIARMDQVQRLAPLVLLQFFASLPTIEERNDAAGRYPENGSEHDHGHCGIIIRKYLYEFVSHPIRTDDIVA